MSVRFDAETDAYTATTGLPASTTWSFTAWVYIAVDRDTFSGIFSLAQAGDSVRSQLCTDSDGTTLHLYDNNLNGSGISAGFALTAATWHRVAVACSGANVTYYVGTATGALSSASASNYTPASPPATLRLARQVGSSQWWNGRIAAFKMWQAQLNQTEIETELAQFEPVRTTNLLRYHPLHVPDLADYSGNGNNLTVGSTGTIAEADPPTGGAVTMPLWVADRGTTANVTAGSSQAHTITSPTTVAVGNYLIARVAVDNTGSSGAATTLSVSDSRSNTWTVLGPGNADPGAASAGSTAYLAYARVVTAYQAADTITFTWGNSSTAKAIVVEEWTNISPTNPVAVSAVTNNSVAAGSTTAVTATIVPTDAYQLVYACLSTEGIAGDSITYDTDSTSGTWSTLTRVASADATATNNQCVAGQQKVVTASGSQTWNATITSRDWAAVVVVFAGLPSTPPLTARRRAPLGALLQF